MTVNNDIDDDSATKHGDSHTIRMTLEFLQKSIAAAKQRSTLILGLDLNSGLGAEGSK